MATLVLTLALALHGAEAINLLPSDSPSVQVSPAYWCSWQAQGRGWLFGATKLNLTKTQGDDYWRNRSHQQWMDQSNQVNMMQNDTVSGREGWAWLFPKARKDMIMVLDNGWQNGPEAVSHQLDLDPKKYPMFANASSKADKLKMFGDALKNIGWKGLGVWTIGGTPMNASTIAILRDADISLLKFDGGDNSCKQTAIAREAAPDLVVEHGLCGTNCPINGAPGSDGQWPWANAVNQAKVLACTDLFRTYDMVKILSVSEVIGRQANLLLAAYNKTTDKELLKLNPLPRRLFGGSGEPVVTVALGGVMQPMRGNLRGTPLLSNFNGYVGEGPNSRHRQHREDEITRLARWSRIAPPFSVGLMQADGSVTEKAPLLDDHILYDSHNFSLCDDACVISHHLEGVNLPQGAPARVTRNGLPLPNVSVSSGPLPWVIATQFPNGPVSITTIGRQITGVGWIEPKATVSLEVPQLESNTTIGIFGYYESLELKCKSKHALLDIDFKVFAQDLASDSAVDISAKVTWSQAGSATTLSIPGALIEQVGLSAKSRPDDVSAPGLVLLIQ
eukprot:m.83542 g.83542  ORF g.83542 m.83542 type:complete len:561 (+) comp12926_c0_seq1:110-1792(+)